MAILNKHQLVKLAQSSELLGNDYDENNFQPSSYDLRIGALYKDKKIWSDSYPHKKKYNVTVKPGEIVNMLTLEDVKIPNDCCGTVFAINRMSSRGFLILNPGHIDPGFHGPLSICAINLSNKNEILDLRQSVFTLILKRLEEELSEEDAYQSSFVRTERKEYEKNYLNSSYSNLSSSIFDLVVNYRKAISWLLFRVIENLGKWIAVFAGIAAINQGILYFYPSLWRQTDAKRERQIEKKITDSLNVEFSNKEKLIRDSISIYYEKREQYLLDSMNRSIDSKRKLKNETGH
ncbi:MAG: hypothetical protein ABJF04_19690 [Reichenbachiella sp.]|uniref:dCTP deaminase domain-containing protein n=1 Tax=Reichenbachiella sp. TaxID=2184521 RepID=UPI0032632D57